MIDRSPGGPIRFVNLDRAGAPKGESANAIGLVNGIFHAAIEQKASDFHLEPAGLKSQLRFRVDGLLREIDSLESAEHEAVINRIKVLGHLDIGEKRVPQDGSLRLQLAGREIDIRISTFPTIHGEKLVARILDPVNQQTSLEQLGFSPDQLQGFRHAIQHSQGFVLVTGPTGSGKTTTLYSALLAICHPALNIVTLEDPVEYKIPGLTQTQIRPAIGFDYQAAMRHVLRQDPDVILIGEIRDGESARLAVQASLTGHLLFSTLHTNSCADSFLRLVELGIQPIMLASTLRLIVAQRLLRRCCPLCHGSAADPDCPSCKGSGYHGRLAVFELLDFTGELRTRLLSTRGLESIHQLLVEETRGSLKESGLRLVEEGVTDMNEIQRVLS